MIVNGAPAVSAVHQPVSVLAFVITRSRIVQIYSLFDLARVRRSVGDPSKASQA